jgi:uncharacterized repeat protein (TIGR01451 family)
MRAIRNNRKGTLLALGAVTALLVTPAVPAFAGPGDSNPGDSVTICHATSSDTNPYVVNSPNKNGDVSGHADHKGPVWNPTLKDTHTWWGDIIPAFDYNDNGTTKHFDGLNWDANGQAWLDNGCVVPITFSVLKTNDANGDTKFSDSEVATTVGADVTFQAVVTNNSVVPAVVSSFTDVVGTTAQTMTDVTPSIVGTTLAAGESVTVTFTVADYTPADNGVVVNTVGVMGYQEGNEANVSKEATDTSTVTTYLPDVSVVKTGPAAAVAPGDTFDWTLRVFNDGKVPVPGVVVTDTLPADVTLVQVTADAAYWTTKVEGQALTMTYVGDLPVADPVPADAADIVITVTLSAAYTDPTIVNTGVVAPTDATPADNSSTVTTEVTTGGGGTIETPTPTPSSTSTFTGGGGGATNLPRTGGPLAFLLAGALALVLSGLGVVLLSPRGKHS